jgi:HD-GYP domain-containing protein (c-di-GMP phosphodiesterase class II)
MKNQKVIYLPSFIGIKSLLTCLKMKDQYTFEHSCRVAYFSVLTGKKMGLGIKELRELEISALFHDIGKIGIPDNVLKKPTRLDEEEFKTMKSHPVRSDEIIQTLEGHEHLSKNVKHHHERFDGRGYPEGLKGENIPLFARIILVADTFDAMVSDRPYRKGMDYEVSFAELLEFSGSQFDPKVVSYFIEAVKESEHVDDFHLESINQSFPKKSAA